MNRQFLKPAIRALMAHVRAYAEIGLLALQGRRISQAWPRWRSPEELVRIGFACSRVVMINEAHNGWLRCPRTREVGQRILPTAHAAGVRHLAMEVLWPHFADEANQTRRLPEVTQSYLAQPEMRAFVEVALALGWTLIPYEADTQHQPAELSYMQSVNWREEQQARNLIAALGQLPAGAKLLVWCGNSHHCKQVLNDWAPMGYQFQRMSGIAPFVIDQTITVNFDSDHSSSSSRLVAQFGQALAAHGGMVGMLVEDHPAFAHYEGSDAVVLSLDNEIE